MSHKSLPRHEKRGINRTGPQARQRLTAPRHETPSTEVDNMPFEHDIGDSEQECKTCPKCNESKSVDRFAVSPASKGGRRRICNDCRSFDNFLRGNPSQEQIEDYKSRKIIRRKRGGPQKPRWKHLKRKYGVTEQDYKRMEAQQGGRCAICLTDEPGGRFNVLVVDHCHETGRVRGLLCHKCNSAIGVLGDTPEAIARAFLHMVSGSNRSLPDKWKAIGELAAALAAKAGAE